jgi:hypothetical protein
MLNMLKQLTQQLIDPSKFFDNMKNDTWKSSFSFFLWVTSIISVITPIVNFFGVESTDLSSSYQAQIMAYNFVKNSLLQAYGSSAYIIEAMLIFALAIPILLFLTVFLHLLYRAIGGQGPTSHAWKAACYGVGPCLLGGFLPYIALFAGFYSFAMQFYLGPRELYDAKEGRAIIVFVALIALTFIEMFVFGSTAGF